METELDASLGYEKNRKGEVQTSNQRQKAYSQVTTRWKRCCTLPVGMWSKMDAALQELGPGTEPADRPVRGAVYPAPVKGKAGNATLFQTFQPNLILSALAVLPGSPILILESGCGQSPRKTLLLPMPGQCAKNSKNMHRM